MARHNAANERIKREYFDFLREAKGRDESTIDRAAMALARFENSTGAQRFPQVPPRTGNRLQAAAG